MDMLIWLLGFGLLFLIGAYYDIKKREVPDLLTASMWILVIVGSFFFNMDSRTYGIIGITFTLLYFVNSISVYFLKKPYLEWGDILIYPIFTGSLAIMGYANPPIFLMAILTLFFGLILPLILKRGIPFIPIVFISYLGSLGFWAVYLR
jgi:Flp pilus assembly protein protease CpaA